MCRSAKMRSRRRYLPKERNRHAWQLFRPVSGSCVEPCTSASSSRPSIRGHSASNRPISLSPARRRSSGINSSVKNTGAIQPSLVAPLSPQCHSGSDRPGGDRTKLHLGREEPPHCETASGRRPAEGVGNPQAAPWTAVEGERRDRWMVHSQCDEQIPILAGRTAKVVLGSSSARTMAEKVDFADLPAHCQRRDRVGPDFVGRQASRRQASTNSASDRSVEKGSQHLDRYRPDGNRQGLHPGGRRKPLAVLQSRASRRHGFPPPADLCRQDLGKPTIQSSNSDIDYRSGHRNQPLLRALLSFPNYDACAFGASSVFSRAVHGICGIHCCGEAKSHGADRCGDRRKLSHPDVEKLGRLRQIDEDIGLLRTAPVSLAVSLPMASWSAAARPSTF